MDGNMVLVLSHISLQGSIKYVIRLAYFVGDIKYNGMVIFPCDFSMLPIRIIRNWVSNELMFVTWVLTA